eukprot:6197206-Pleurochrysis_carterae.AAC.5
MPRGASSAMSPSRSHRLGRASSSSNCSATVEGTPSSSNTRRSESRRKSCWPRCLPVAGADNSAT